MNARAGLRTLLALGAVLLSVLPAAAQYAEERYDDDVRLSVARISFFEGDVSFNRGDDPDAWQPASLNYPVSVGDRLWTASGARAELQLPGATLYLAPESELGALDLTREARQLSIGLGTATVRLRRLEREELFEIATPNVSVTFEGAGVCRIDVDEDGDTRVSVYSGRASAMAAGTPVALEAGDRLRVRGLDRPEYDVVGLARTDSWDRWVENRGRRYRSARSVSYVHPDVYGVEDLDGYGSWQNVPEYGAVWFPSVPSSDWEPYRDGRWVWRDPWGWTWVSSEPWGWAPYHYGRWAVVRGRWCWVPVGPHGPRPAWSPALVAFVGGGPGWSVSVTGGGFVGWFPLGPGEPFSPWWRHSHPSRPAPDQHYAYRERAVVVPRDVFAGGRRIDRDVVRTSPVRRDVLSAPVLNGPIPVLPTREAIRFGGTAPGSWSGTRPPERIERREVVTRTAPPPPPPTFDRKMELIRESGGEPVPVNVPRRPATDEHRGGGWSQPAPPAGRGETVPTPRGEVEPYRRPATPPPAGDRPADATERPTPRSGWPWGPAPTQAAPTPRAERGEPTRPPVRGFDRPEPAPTPRSERVPFGEPRVERPESAAPPSPTAVRFRVPRDEPRVEVPRRAEPEAREAPKPSRVEPEKASPRSAPPEKEAPKATPTPARKREKRMER